MAVHYPGQEEIARFTIRNTPTEIRKLVNRIRKQSPGHVRFCYEAGVCGFTLKRRIEALGCSCSVIAPSLVPTQARRAGQDGSPRRSEASGSVQGRSSH